MNYWLFIKVITKNKNLSLTAGVLPLTIALSLIMAVICSVMILLMYFNNLMWLNYKQSDEIYNHLESGIELIKSTSIGDFPINKNVKLDLLNDQLFTTIINRRKWGFFDWYKVSVQNQNIVRQVNFFGGIATPYYKDVGLYLSNIDGLPLTMIGTAKVNGNACLPSQGVKAGYLNYKSFLGAKLINGKWKKSDKKVPEINEDCRREFRNLMSNDLKLTTRYRSDVDCRNIYNSFEDSTLCFFVEEAVTLTQKIQGNVIICSKTVIEISNSCVTDNIIVCAPLVKVRSGFKGSLQIFASESIVIEEHVKLEYPTMLICDDKSHSHITIENNCTIEGGLFLISQESGDSELKGKIETNHSLIKGLVYSQGSIVLQGKVLGQVISNRLIHYGRNGKMYKNYLVDGIIDYHSNKNHYLYPHVFSNDNVMPSVLVML
ncbi:MAG: hypothetical protein N4A74_19115 [Carboxylicivirga sp.]|jgi:hypothetical protein|nr:hypothetical protein [Carboxylicivirga sp.]